jgi:hypothetical protein
MGSTADRHPVRDVAIVAAVNTEPAKILKGHDSLSIIPAGAQLALTEAAIEPQEADAIFSRSAAARVARYLD